MTEEIVKMPDCVTCKKPWEMSKGEHTYYTDMMRKKPGNFSMPTHCAECRSKKKEKYSCKEVADFLKDIIVKVDKEEYAFDDEKLVEDLKKLEKMVKKMNRQGPNVVKEENVPQEA